MLYHAADLGALQAGLDEAVSIRIYRIRVNVIFERKVVRAADIENLKILPLDVQHDRVTVVAPDDLVGSNSRHGSDLIPRKTRVGGDVSSPCPRQSSYRFTSSVLEVQMN